MFSCITLTVRKLEGKNEFLKGFEHERKLMLGMKWIQHDAYLQAKLVTPSTIF